MQSKEPLERNAVVEQRDQTLLTGFGDSDLPSRYTDKRGFAKTWQKAARAYKRHRIGEESNKEFQNTLHGKARMKYGQCLDLDRWTREQYQNRHTALLSLRISPTYGEVYLHPLLQIDVLQEAWKASKGKLPSGELFKIIAGTEWFATSHIHIVHFHEGKISRDDYRAFAEAFVESCDVLDTMEGNLLSQGAGSVLSDDEIDFTEYQGEQGDPVTPATTYVGRQIPHLKPVHECSEADLLFYTAVNASSRRPFYRSQEVPRDSDHRQPVLSGKSTQNSPNQFTSNQEIIAD